MFPWLAKLGWGSPFISSPFMRHSMTYCIGMGMASEGSILILVVDPRRGNYFQFSINLLNRNGSPSL